MKKKVATSAKHRKQFQYTLPFIFVVILASLCLSYWNISQVKKITSFEECAAARHPIRETYPPQCTTPQGKIFIQKILPTPTPAEIVIRGELVCLPHRDTKGPHTMECAFGLKDEHGNYYGLRDSDPNYTNLSQPTGKSYEVRGILTPKDDEKYQSIGVILVQSLTAQD